MWKQKVDKPVRVEPDQSSAKLKRLMAIGAVVALLACARNDVVAPLDVDRVRSIAVPGATISVRGYLAYEPENRNLYATRQAFERTAVSQCISLAFRPQDVALARQLHGRLVEVRGIYQAPFCPRGSICPGACSQGSGISVATLTAR